MSCIATVVGARPQLIKSSVVSSAMRALGLEEVLIHTGQHFDDAMSQVFFDELGMSPPAYNLAISGGPHGEMTGRMMAEIERVLLVERPDALLVYGDTNSTLAGALAAAKLHIPVAHVEAGLRSFNMRMPEEINRIVTDRVSRWLFTPTELANSNLRQEGVLESSIELVGDVMYDAALHFGVLAENRDVLRALGLARGEYVLTTIHRAENTDLAERLNHIVDGLLSVGATRGVVWPMHPRTSAALTRLGRLDEVRDVLKVIPPAGYLDMVALTTNAGCVATDSGGVQKEAFFHGVPCVTLRNETEWLELVEAGWNTLTPPTSAAEVREAILSSFGRAGRNVAPYGDGDSASKIVTRLLEDLRADLST